MCPVPLRELYPELENAYRSRRYADPAVRRRWLRALRAALRASRDEVYAALAADLHRSPGQTLVADLVPALGELDYLARSLRRLARGRRVNSSLMLAFGSCWERPMPLGPTLIIVPFNYPLQLALSPAAASVACGNPTAVKMSRDTPATAALLEAIIARAGIPRDLLSVVTVDDFSELWSDGSRPRSWGKVFFTGSTDVGREIAKNAALALTSVTLELGGSNPFILSASHVSAVCRGNATGRRAVDYVLFAKFLNAGQTCISPNYLLVVDGGEAGTDYEAVLRRLAARLASLYYRGGGISSALQSPHLARLITPAARERVRALVDAAVRGGARVVAPEDLEDYLARGCEPKGAGSAGETGPSADAGCNPEDGGSGGSPVSQVGEQSSRLLAAPGDPSKPDLSLPLDPERFFPPTILDFGELEKDSEAHLLSRLPAAFLAATAREIFGPVLPVLRVHSFSQAIALVHAMQPTTQSKPLASYIFTDDAGEARTFEREIPAGSSVINSAILQSACHLPFGGVGTSGQGRYHGHYSFETFSHYKPVLRVRRPWLHALTRPNLLPPYRANLPICLLTKVMFFAIPTPAQGWAIAGGVICALVVLGLLTWALVCQLR